MTDHPAFDVLSKHGIQPVTNSPDGTFMTNCRNPKCGKLNTNFVQYDDETVGWHCEACGDSRIVSLRPARAKTDGNAASVPFMLTAAQKVELHALGYSNEQILHITPQDGLDIIAQKRRAPAKTGGNGKTIDDDEYQRRLEEAKNETEQDQEQEQEPGGPKGPKEPPKEPPKE